MCRGGGTIAGALVGYLLRPSVPIIGQLSFFTILTRGGNLDGLDVVIKGAAETSFNYMAILAAVGLTVALKVSTSPPHLNHSSNTPRLAGSNGFCVNCGQPLSVGDGFCSACGCKRS